MRSSFFSHAIAVGLVFAVCTSTAQPYVEPNSIFDDDLEVTGGFISITPRFTNVLGAYTALGAFNAGVVLNERFYCGLGFAVSGTPIKNPGYENYLIGRTSANLDGLEFKYGYAGILVEPVIGAKHVVHLKTPLLIGMGWANYSYPAMSTNNASDSSKRRIRTDGQGYLVIEPGVELEMNILRSLRLCFGGTYVYTSDLELPYTPSDALRNFTLKFGLNWVILNRMHGPIRY